MANILKSKTLIFAMLLAVFSAVQGFVVQLPITPQEQAAVGLVISVIVAVLRVLTTVPLADK